MRTAASISELNRDSEFRDVVVACGVFDGVHRGHQQILAALRRLARRSGARAVALTFEPHPRTVLRPYAAPLRLTSLPQKLRLFEESGMEGVVVLPFSKEVAAMPPEQFVVRKLQAPGVCLRGVCVGRNWRFGARGEGNTRLLRKLGRRLGFALVAVPEFLYYGRPVSSTRIRRDLGHGRLEFCARLLGRPYAAEGIVARGQGLGASVFGCPTANVSAPGQLLPPHGVYAAAGVLQTPASRKGRAQGSVPGIAYVGTRPTITEGTKGPAFEPVLEFHGFDCEVDWYGQRLEVQFLKFLRPDRVFPDLAGLKAQIAADIAAARTLFPG